MIFSIQYFGYFDNTDYDAFKEGREIRRKDREITSLDEIVEIMKKCDVCRIAIHDEEYPYILPVNFGFERIGEKIIIYVHGSKQGTKHSLIQKNNKVSFEMDCSHRLIQPGGEDSCTTSMAYESVIGQGEMVMLTEEEKAHALTVILDHYQVETKKFHPVHFANTIAYSIRCSSYTAKRRI